jgi:hypothetical protein
MDVSIQCAVGRRKTGFGISAIRDSAEQPGCDIEEKLRTRLIPEADAYESRAARTPRTLMVYEKERYSAWALVMTMPATVVLFGVLVYLMCCRKTKRSSLLPLSGL